MTEVLQYLHRVGNIRLLAGKTIINNVYTFMRGKTPDFTRARSVFDREKIYHQMLRQEKSYSRLIRGDCYIETAGVTFLCRRKNGKHKMTYQKNEAFGFIMSNKYILGYISIAGKLGGILLYVQPKYRTKGIQLIGLWIWRDLEVLAHCLLLDDGVWRERLIGKLYTIFIG